MTKKNTKKYCRRKQGRILTLKRNSKIQKTNTLDFILEFENYRRRTSKEKIEMIDLANKDLLSDILPVIDDFERAIKSIEKEKSSEMEGVNLYIKN